MLNRLLVVLGLLMGRLMMRRGMALWYKQSTAGTSAPLTMVVCIRQRLQQPHSKSFLYEYKFAGLPVKYVYTHQKLLLQVESFVTSSSPMTSLPSLPKEGRLVVKVAVFLIYFVSLSFPLTSPRALVLIWCTRERIDVLQIPPLSHLLFQNLKRYRRLLAQRAKS